jgi:phosphoglycolate phosphatase-like HAD superfamily hydrolase
MIEVINPNIVRGRIRHALFDFDGTLSLIREGWQQIMIPLMVEWLRQAPNAEPDETLQEVAADFVARTTGIQTIYQMIHVAEEVARRGGQPLDAREYKRIYVERLWRHVEHRVAGLKQGRIPADDLMVPGARAILGELQRRGVVCYLASGTDEPNVFDEATALGIAPFFAGIYGAREDYQSFSKKILVQKIIADHRLAGPELVVFGDGFVEIEDGKSVGGIAVGVASDEATRSGVNAWKRQRLIQAGADIIIPDFAQAETLVAYLFAEKDAAHG